jgi:hypothetical protein
MAQPEGDDAKIDAMLKESHGCTVPQGVWGDDLAFDCLVTLISGCSGNEVRLFEVCDAIIDNLHSNPVYADKGVPCVRSPDVGWGTLNLATALRTDEAEYTRRTVRGEPAVDDIVLVALRRIS